MARSRCWGDWVGRRPGFGAGRELRLWGWGRRAARGSEGPAGEQTDGDEPGSAITAAMVASGDAAE